jgi:carboxy-cis,cis-muconate cyclase
MYSVDHKSGHLSLLSDTKSPREHDGPRHVVISPDGRVLYSVTEHSESYYFLSHSSFSDLTASLTASFVDVYNVTETTLVHLQSISILPPDSNPSDYRGDTLRLRPPSSKSPSPNHLFATTRGFDTSHKGFIAVFSILPTGLLDTQESKIERWQTPTSGGKANAIELKAKVAEDTTGSDPSAEGVWIALTDDEPDGGGLWILEWDGEGTGGLKIVAEWSSEGGESMDGASHAIWLD